jgi:hypothetical protein
MSEIFRSLYKHMHVGSSLLAAVFVSTLLCPLTGNAQTPVSTITGPTILQARCGIFSSAFFQYWTTYQTPAPTGYGMQMCTWISDWPSNPITVTNGTLNVVFPVIYMGDPQDGPGGANSPVPGSAAPPGYAFGQSHANFTVNLTANDVSAVGVVNGASMPNTSGSDCTGSQLVAGTAVNGTFTASISGDVMTVTSITTGSINVLETVSGPGVAVGTQITGALAGTGTGTGTYTVSIPQTVASESMTTGASSSPAQSQASGSITLYDFAAPDAPAGAAATGQQAVQNSGISYGELVIPINVSWAQSILTFSITVSQGVPGNDPENMSYEVPECNSDVCKVYPFWTNQDTFNTANNPPSPAYSMITCPEGQNCTCPQAQASEVDVVPFAAFQLGYLPLAVIYSPIGTKGSAQYTLSDISGTQFSFGSNVNLVNALTADDKESTTLSVKGEGTTGSGTGTWDLTVENDEGASYGQVATVTNTTELDEMIPNSLPANWPAVSAMTYYSEPFHNDMIIVAPNPQFEVWSYPEGFFAMPIGSALPFQRTVDQLAACASNRLGTTPVQGPTPPGNGAPATYNLTAGDCAALLTADPFAVQDTQDAILVPPFIALAGASVNVYKGGTWTEKNNTMTSVQSSVGSTYTTNVTALSSLETQDTDNPLAAFEKEINVSIDYSNTTSSSAKTSLTMTFSAASTTTLQNGVVSSNQVLDTSPTLPPNTSSVPDLDISVNVVQDTYFGTIAFQDQSAQSLPHCLLESGGVIVFNPAPGCQGTTLTLPVNLGCIYTGTCLKNKFTGEFSFLTAQAQANVFKLRHIARPVIYVRGPAQAVFPSAGEVLKLVNGAKIPAQRLQTIKTNLTAVKIEPPK